MGALPASAASPRGDPGPQTVAAARARLADAERARADAAARLEEARAEVLAARAGRDGLSNQAQAVSAEFERRGAQARALAVSAYVGGQESAVGALLDGDEFTTAAWRRHLTFDRVAAAKDAANGYRSLRSELDGSVAAAADRSGRAEARVEQAAADLDRADAAVEGARRRAAEAEEA
ncbi:MAG: hypothetical protein ACKVWR_12045, partial [Acidimicrobiales bacterium]